VYKATSEGKRFLKGLHKKKSRQIRDAIEAYTRMGIPSGDLQRLQHMIQDGKFFGTKLQFEMGVFSAELLKKMASAKTNQEQLVKFIKKCTKELKKM
jgi:hypothetical protein